MFDQDFQVGDLVRRPFEDQGIETLLHDDARPTAAATPTATRADKIPQHRSKLVGDCMSHMDDRGFDTRLRRFPLCGRNVELREVADTALFLASNMSSGITGEIIYVDCGANIMAG